MKKRIIICIVLYFSFIALAFFLGSCKEQEPQPKERICIYKLNPTQVDGSCVPNCPPYRTFLKCDDKINAYKYTDLIIEECNC